MLPEDKEVYQAHMRVSHILALAVHGEIAANANDPSHNNECLQHPPLRIRTQVEVEVEVQVQVEVEVQANKNLSARKQQLPLSCTSSLCPPIFPILLPHFRLYV